MERPILFSGLMVNAILTGKKTQTRRVIKPQPVKWNKSPDLLEWKSFHLPPEGLIAESPYGGLGDSLWVRETFDVRTIAGDTVVFYRADCGSDGDGAKWKPSIFMPRSLSRIMLKITDVQVERLHEVSEEAAVAEGVRSVTEFHLLWNAINPKYPWKSNPWAWVIEFQKV